MGLQPQAILSNIRSISSVLRKSHDRPKPESGVNSAPSPSRRYANTVRYNASPERHFASVDLFLTRLVMNRRIVVLEDDLKTVGSNMKALEIAEQEVRETLKSCLSSIRSVSTKSRYHRCRLAARCYSIYKTILQHRGP